MRISAELLHQAGQRLNPMDERELDLRNLGIPALENMAVTLDAFDAWDLSNNRLGRLDNFPRLHRLKNLLCAANVIESVDASNMAQNVPNLHSLTLSGNNISQLAEVAKLGTACPKLEFLTLDGNPVTSKFFVSGVSLALLCSTYSCFWLAPTNRRRETELPVVCDCKDKVPQSSRLC